MNEYLTFFTNDGNIDIEVIFLKSSVHIAKLRASISEITRLLESLESNKQPCMTFDEYQGTITKITIDPILKQIKSHQYLILIQLHCQFEWLREEHQQLL